MSGGQRILLTAATALTLAGCAQTGALTIRAKPTGLAMGERPVSFRIAEARGQFALGNVALSLEGFRKALREDPGSIDAMNGIAACYDRMGRFDLSREYYEMALAIAPSDQRLYSNFALSLEMQGRHNEAQTVRAELANRRSAGQAADASLAAVELDQVKEGTQVPGPMRAVSAEHPGVAASGLSSLTVPLPATVAMERPSGTGMRPVAEPAASVSIALPLAAPPPRSPNGARLERLSQGEVALVTSGPLQWKRRSAERPQHARLAANGAAQASAPAGLVLLNAARSEGLAARTRSLLHRDGVHRITIGDAAQVRRSSIIAYPTSRRAEAVKLASRLGFALQHKPGSGNRLVIYLGRDAATALVARHP